MHTEENGLAKQAAGAGAAIRAVVVYRYPVYRDLITRVLEKAEVQVAGALGVGELSQESLRSLDPDVLVIYDPDANSLLREVAAPALADPIGCGVCRVVCVGSDNEMVVWHRLVIPNPSVEGLVSCVKGAIGEAESSACHAAGLATHQRERPERQSTGSGGT